MRMVFFQIAAAVFGMAVATSAARAELTLSRLANLPGNALLLTDPQKKSRPCMCQFGYGLYFHHIPINEVTQILEPGNWGTHSYGKPSRAEKNGLIYTCRGGFVDSSHARAGADWTAHLAVSLAAFLDDPTRGDTLRMRFTPDRAELSVAFPRPERRLEVEDVIRLAQRIAYERLLWHEVGSWYTTPPIKMVSERISTFSPEDSYSNLLGTYFGAQAIRDELMDAADGLTNFSQAVDGAIEDWMARLEQVDSVESTKAAFDDVDGDWWDKKGDFPAPQCVKKREVRVFGEVHPWLIPHPEKAGCDAEASPISLEVPERTTDGRALESLYVFEIVPNPENTVKTDGIVLPPRFTARDLPAVVDLVARDLRRVLGQYATPMSSPSSNRSSSFAQ